MKRVKRHEEMGRRGTRKYVIVKMRGGELEA
jgi:hypothetical protein